MVLRNQEPSSSSSSSHRPAGCCAPRLLRQTQTAENTVCGGGETLPLPWGPELERRLSIGGGWGGADVRDQLSFAGIKSLKSETQKSAALVPGVCVRSSARVPPRGGASPPGASPPTHPPAHPRAREGGAGPPLTPPLTLQRDPIGWDSPRASQSGLRVAFSPALFGTGSHTRAKLTAGQAELAHLSLVRARRVGGESGSGAGKGRSQGPPLRPHGAAHPFPQERTRPFRGWWMLKPRCPLRANGKRPPLTRASLTRTRRVTATRIFWVRPVGPH